MTSAGRTGELQALSIHQSFCRILPDGAAVILHPDPAFLPKWLSKLHLNQSVELCMFYSPQQAKEVEGQWSPLCLVKMLTICKSNARRQASTRTNKTVVCFKPESLGRLLSKFRLLCWVVEAIQQANRGMDGLMCTFDKE